MCDFEMAFLKAAGQRYTLVKVKCCLFHFTQSVFRNSRDAINAVEKAAGENGEKTMVAMRAIRRVMGEVEFERRYF